MKSIFDIRIQKLFLVTFVLKVGSSFLGWKFQDPWILGFAVPLLIMGVYIVLGYFRRDKDVSDEKFADTCYYLGFIFTITSIIFSLFDLPYIGTRIQDIAVRFGAAMVSTVLGLAVRVYLVSFKKDVADAIQDAEEAVIDATRKFTEQLNVARERLCDFEVQVDNAAKTSVERVNVQIENMSKNHADKLTAFFSELTSKNQEAFTGALAEVKSASQKLAESVDGYSLGMRANLGSIEAKVGAFTDAVTERLKTTTFPDDYFAKQLSTPLAQLKESSSALASGIQGSVHEVAESTALLSSALKKLRDKAGATEGSLDTVLKLTLQQQAVLDAAQGQLASLEQLGGTLKRIDETLASTLAGVVASNGLNSELAHRIGGIVADGAETRKTLEAALNGVTETLKAQVQATGTVVVALESGAASSSASAMNLANKLDASIVAAESASKAFTAATDVSTVVAGKLESVAAADMKTVEALDALGRQATSALGRVDGAVVQLQGMVRQLTALDATLRARNDENRAVEPHLQRGAPGGLSRTGASLAATLPVARQPHEPSPFGLQESQQQPTSAALPGGHATALAGARPAFATPSPAELTGTSPVAKNGAMYGPAAPEGAVAGAGPAPTLIQVPMPGFAPNEQADVSMLPASEQPPST